MAASGAPSLERGPAAYDSKADIALVSRLAEPQELYELHWNACGNGARHFFRIPVR